MKKEQNNQEPQNPALRVCAVKCRFFAQYWGQFVKSSDIHKSKGLRPIEINAHSIQYVDENSFLELKQLSTISNADAIEVARLNKSINWNDKKPEVWLNSFQDTVVSNGKGLIDKYGQTIVTNLDYLNREQIDLLRSKGYCVPFMEYSVLELFRLGWVRFS